MSTVFDDEHFRQAYPDGYADHYWHVARDRIVIDAVRSVVPAGATCLEIGCGRGHFVAALKDSGYDARGVELGRPRLLPEAASLVETGQSFADLSVESRRKTKCVLLLDVIEHLSDPSRFLRDVRASFPNLAAAVLTVPARREIWSNYDDHYGHFRRYTIDTLRGEAQAAGLHLVGAHYAFRALYLAALGLRWLGIERGVVQQAPGNRALHRLIGEAFVLETRLLPKRVPGSSLIGIAVPQS